MKADRKKIADLNTSKRFAYSNSGNYGPRQTAAPQQTLKSLINQMYTDEQGQKVKPSLEDFSIARIVGSGACATVKLAMHERLKKRFALKIYAA